VAYEPTKRMAGVAAATLLVDQVTKLLVYRSVAYGDEKVVLEGFFRLVHWGNRGAAWSLFNRLAGSNEMLALFAILALVILYWSRHHFDAHTLPGQISLGLIFGGIAGNLLDRFLRGHVVDFLYFFVNRRGGGEVGFPAFNIADTAICTGVALLFLLSWQKDRVVPAGSPTAKPG
jgi:signal peptidase II